MPVVARFGHRFGQRLLKSDGNAKELSTGTVDAAILSLLGLLTAFTFSSAYSRYDARRQLIVDEANAIGTAYLRLDLVPEDRQPALRNKFREYVHSRSELWRLLSDRQAALAEYRRSEELQTDIWSLAVDATKDETHGDARKLLLPALNEMIDITTTRLIAVQSHPPLIIFLLLGTLSLAAAWIVGFGMAKTERLSHAHAVGFAVMAAFALYVILDIEYPRFGFVTLDAPHQLLIDLEQRIR
jgi:hypothetical protein